MGKRRGGKGEKKDVVRGRGRRRRLQCVSRGPNPRNLEAVRMAVTVHMGKRGRRERGREARHRRKAGGNPAVRSADELATCV